MNLSPAMTAKILALAGIAGELPESGTRFTANVPLPPSTNNLFLSRRRRRVKSPEYLDWLAVAVPILRTLRRPRTLPAKIVVSIFGPLNQASDLDNRLKAVGDALVKAQVIPGDNVKYIRGWRIDYEGDWDGAGVIAMVQVIPVV